MKKTLNKMSIMLKKADMLSYCCSAPVFGVVACVMAAIIFSVLFVNFDKLTMETKVAIVATAILLIAGCVDAAKKMFERIAHYKSVLKNM